MRRSISAVSGSHRVIGVFGFPVEHSLSPAMHNAAFSALGLPFVYVPFLVKPEEIGAAVRGLVALGIVGANLTIPHKETVIPFLDEISPEARAVRAVNTVVTREGRLVGYNTDGVGFIRPLEELGFKISDSRSVVMGAGGSARSAVYALARRGGRVTIINRTADRARALASDINALVAGMVEVVEWADAAGVGAAFAQSHLVVNTTRIGMHPDVAGMPGAPLTALQDGAIVYDLIYNPVETRLLRESRIRGLQTLNGVKMLVYQGAAAFELFTGVAAPAEVMALAVLNGLGST